MFGSIMSFLKTSVARIAGAADDWSEDDQMVTDDSEEHENDSEDVGEPPLDESDEIDLSFLEEASPRGAGPDFGKLAETEGLNKDMKTALLAASQQAGRMSDLERQLTETQGQVKELQGFLEGFGTPDQPGELGKDFVKEHTKAETARKAVEVDEEEYNKLLTTDGLEAAESYRLKQELTAKTLETKKLSDRLAKLEAKDAQIESEKGVQKAYADFIAFTTTVCKRAKLTAPETKRVLERALAAPVLEGKQPDVAAIIIDVARERKDTMKAAEDRMAQATERKGKAALHGVRPGPAEKGVPAGGGGEELPAIEAGDLSFGEFAKQAVKILGLK